MSALRLPCAGLLNACADEPETDSAVIVVRDGTVVWEKVETAMDDDLRPEYDLGSLRVHKVGPKRKNFKGQMETEVTTLGAAGRRESGQSRDELEEDGRK